jgi:DNA-binding response OmpR family regulator
MSQNSQTADQASRYHPLVLLVQDEPSQAKKLTIALNAIAFDVVLANSGPQGIRAASNHKNLVAIVVDLCQSFDAGLELCKSLLNLPAPVPVLFVYAEGSRVQQLVALELGASDCLSRPYDIQELLIRLRLAIRRTKQQLVPTKLTCGRLVIDWDGRVVKLESKTIDLSPKEFDLIYFLALRSGTVFSRSDLLHHVWQTDFKGQDHTVDSHINRLRRKLGESANCARFIHTVWARGYRFHADQE